MYLTTIVPLDRYNWELCLDISLTPEQEQYVPPVLYSLAQAKFEQLHPYGILHEEKMVGLIMYGEFAGICWINRVVVDKAYQGKGIGSSALRQLIAMLRGNIRCKEIRSSYAQDNMVALRFFESIGFRMMPNSLKDEIVVVYRP